MEDFIILGLVGVFGLLIGSFLNVVILRYNTGRSIVADRSGCFTCGKTLQWYELFPLFSWLAQGGRCRGCATPISWQYPAVELINGLMLVGIVWQFGITWTAALWAIIWSVWLVVAVYDLRHKIVPDAFSATLAIASLMLLFVAAGGFPGWWPLAAGVLVPFPLFLLWAVSRGRWLGFGDVKLAVTFGLMFGVCGGFGALFLSFFVGAMIGIAILLCERIYKNFPGITGPIKMIGTTGHEIPFVPFMVIGAAFTFFFNIGFPQYCLMWSQILPW